MLDVAWVLAEVVSVVVVVVFMVSLVDVGPEVVVILSDVEVIVGEVASCVSVVDDDKVCGLVVLIVDAVGVIVEGVPVDFSCVSVEYADTVGPLVILWVEVECITVEGIEDFWVSVEVIVTAGLLVE